MSETPPPARPLSSLFPGFGRKVEPLQPPAARTPPPPARPPQAEPQPVLEEEPAEGTGYQAFVASRGKLDYFIDLNLFGKLGERQTHVLPKSQFVHACIDETTHAVLKFADGTCFLLEGRGMQQLAVLMKRGTLSTINQWHPSLPEPAEDAPKVTRITEITPDMAAAQDAAMQRERAPDRGR